MMWISATPAMLEAAQVLACLAALLLVMAVGVWAKLGCEPALRRLDGGSEPLSRQSELPLQLLMAAFGLSALAAALAIVDWIW
jgi:hypothetical protein